LHAWLYIATGHSDYGQCSCSDPAGRRQSVLM